MVDDLPNWEDEFAYDYLDHIPPAGYAWEWLRRNPHYRRDYEDLVRHPLDAERLEEVMERRWGVRFRGPTGSLVDRTARPLVAQATQRRGSGHRQPAAIAGKRRPAHT